MHASITATSARAHTTRDVVPSEMPALPLAGDPGPPLPPLHLSSDVLHSLLSLPLELGQQAPILLQSCMATVEEALL